MSKFKTPQEEFWSGEFGNDYIHRNESESLLASNLNFFSQALKSTFQPKSFFEFGANIGMNLKALKLLYPNAKIGGIEINEKAYQELRKLVDSNNVIKGSIFDLNLKEKYDCSLIKGVLIHINPDMLQNVYEKLYETSKKYILICEYYNPSPVTINYRGHKDRLFKRDFAGEFLEKYKDCQLIDYGFSYKGDPNFPQDDITWFLIEK
jgi:spore coat polysaccharide biosynthesis protein SpsF